MKALDKLIEIPSLPYIISGLIFLCSLAFLHINKEHTNNQIEIIKSMEFSHMVAQSSDDLTNNARYYVSTKNPFWREQFENVLKVNVLVLSLFILYLILEPSPPNNPDKNDLFTSLCPCRIQSGIFNSFLTFLPKLVPNAINKNAVDPE